MSLFIQFVHSMNIICEIEMYNKMYIESNTRRKEEKKIDQCYVNTFTIILLYVVV